MWEIYTPVLNSAPDNNWLNTIGFFLYCNNNQYINSLPIHPLEDVDVLIIIAIAR